MSTSRRLFHLFALTLLWVTACTPAITPQPTAAPTIPQPTTVPPTPIPLPTAVPTAVIFPVTLTDAFSRTVTLTAPAQRIISIAPSNTELIFALDAGKLLVGRDAASDYPPAALDVASIGDTYSGLNTEAIVALNPDLVLAAEITAPDQVQALEALGLTVYVVRNPIKFDDLYANLLLLGRLTEHTAAAEPLVASLRARVTAVTDQTLPNLTHPRVFYELDATDPTKPWTTGPGTFMDTLITLAGGDNIGARLSDSYAQISAEEIVHADPEIILLGDAAYGTTPENVAARAGWDTLTAVKNQAIFAFDDNLASRPGPRLVDGLETLARLLHPELFK